MTDKRPGAQRIDRRTETDITAATEALFLDMVNQTENADLKANMAVMNTIMRQVRPYEAALIPDRAAELDVLSRCWAKRDIPRLERLLVAYFERRKALVPKLVKMINHPN